MEIKSVRVRTKVIDKVKFETVKIIGDHSFIMGRKINRRGDILSLVSLDHLWTDQRNQKVYPLPYILPQIDKRDPLPSSCMKHFLLNSRRMSCPLSEKSALKVLLCIILTSFRGIIIFMLNV